jgi:hypothetical protein
VTKERLPNKSTHPKPLKEHTSKTLLQKLKKKNKQPYKKTPLKKVYMIHMKN